MTDNQNTDSPQAGQPAASGAAGQQGGQPAAADDAQPGRLIQTLTGRVVSNKMDKTVTVLVERRVTHPLYAKVVRRSKKYHAHDEDNAYNEGDIVEIKSTRRVSKTKAWVVSKLIEKARVI